jgi:hypothetical protein
MVNPNRFYTYAYLRVDRTPYYIGKGSGKRLYQKGKKEVKLPKDKSRIIFLKTNLTEEEAFKHEKYMISVFGRKDLGTGILRNRTNGGEGVSGVVISEKTRKRMSVSNKIKNKGKKWWNDCCGNSKRSVECPGEGWVPGMSEEIGRKRSEKLKGENHFAYGKKWWNDGCGNTALSIECPGDGWVLGQSENHKIRTGLSTKGKVWWNDNCGNTTRSIECPGEGWVPGRGEDHGKKLSKINKNPPEKTIIKMRKAKKNVKWWNDGNGDTKFSKECPGEGWFPGRGKFKKKP